jgi:hypothetical protein
MPDERALRRVMTAGFRHYGCLLLGLCLLFAVPLLQAEGPPQVVFLIDSSFDMAGGFGGRTRLAVTQLAVRQLTTALPSPVPVGLAAFGHRYRGDCSDVEILVPPGSDDRRQLLQRLTELKPTGTRPLLAALRRLGDALAARPGPATVVVFTTGTDTCETDPCAAIRAWYTGGRPLVVDVIGLQVPAERQPQLACLADAGGGRYFEVNNRSALEAALVAVRGRIEEQVTAGGAAAPAPSTSRLGQLTLRLPAAAVASLASFAIRRQPDGKTVFQVAEPAAESTYSLLEGDYELVLQFASPQERPQSRPAAPVAFTLRGGEIATLNLGAIDFRLADRLRKAPVEWVTLREATTGLPFITTAGNDPDYRFQAKPVPAGRYDIVLKFNGSITLLELASKLEVAAGETAVVRVDTGLRLQPPAGAASLLGGWDLYASGGERPLLEVRPTLQRLGFPLYEAFPLPPGRYDLWLYYKGVEKPVRAAEGLAIQAGEIRELTVGLPPESAGKP